MPKTIKNCFFDKLTFENLLSAHNRAKRHKLSKKEVILYEMNLENNIINLLNNIKNKRYQLGNYREFKIYEPKERIIKALPYVDRIVHQWYVEEFIKPYIMPRFIYTTYACMENRGTHKAVDKVQEYLRKYQRKYGNYWILKCDIKKFFYSIDPHILYNILTKYISDKHLLEFTKLLIFEKRNPGECTGIPIGNFTSQYFANIYLNELDQYVKRILKLDAYVRYMDDFIILLRSKTECIQLKKQIENFLETNLHLELNAKSRYYPSKMGVNFCGYRIFSTHKLLRVDSKKKIKRKVKKWNYEYKHNKLDIHHTMQSINSWLGHTSHCNAYNLEQKILSSCLFLYHQNTFIENEKKLILDIQNIQNDPKYFEK